jgi:hypothetical protein
VGQMIYSPWLNITEIGNIQLELEFIVDKKFREDTNSFVKIINLNPNLNVKFNNNFDTLYGSNYNSNMITCNLDIDVLSITNNYEAINQICFVDHIGDTINKIFTIIKHNAITKRPVNLHLVYISDSTTILDTIGTYNFNVERNFLNNNSFNQAWVEFNFFRT